MKDKWSVENADMHSQLLLDFGWGLYSAITTAIIRDLGMEAFEDLSERLIRVHQERYFVEGLTKLGLGHEESDAIRCAKYHCYSNLVGGLPMGYAEESADKAWVFYLTPSPTFGFGTGIAILRPEYWKRILNGWHARNGGSLGNQRLQAVATHSVGRGDPFDAMYFLDSGRELSPEERLAVRWGEPHPPFSLERLDPVAWGRERFVRGLRNYLIGYIAAYLMHLLELVGVSQTAEIIRYSYRVFLFQRLDTLMEGLSVARKDPHAPALLLKRFQQIFLEDVELHNDDETLVIRQETSRLHRLVAAESGGASDMPRELEEAIADAWSGLADYVRPGSAIKLAASFGRGDERIEWSYS